MTTQRRRHPDRALTAVQVRQIKTPGRHADGGGLYLLVEPTGAKRWVLRTVVQGRRRDIGIGSACLVSLVEAREKAAAFRGRRAPAAIRSRCIGKRRSSRPPSRKQHELCMPNIRVHGRIQNTRHNGLPRFNDTRFRSSATVALIK